MIYAESAMQYQNTTAVKNVKYSSIVSDSCITDSCTFRIMIGNALV